MDNERFKKITITLRTLVILTIDLKCLQCHKIALGILHFKAYFLSNGQDPCSGKKRKEGIF